MNIIRSSLKIFAANIGRSLLSFIGITLFARELGPTQMGIFFLFQATLGMLAIPADFGLTNAVEKRISQGEDGSGIISTAILLKFFLLLPIAISILSFNRVVNKYIGTTVAAYLVFGLFAQEGSKLVIRVLQGELRVGETAALRVVREIVWLLVGLLLVYSGIEAAALIQALIVGLVVVSLWGLYKVETPIGRPTKEHAISLFTYSKYVFITSAGAFLFNWMDILVIGYFMSQEFVGVYEVSWRLTSVVLLLSRSIAISIFPQISEWSATDATAKVERLITNSIIPAVAIVIPAFFGSVLLSVEILQFVFGAEYIIASLALIILMGQTVFQGLHAIVGRSLQAIDKPDLAAKAAIVSITVNLVLNIILVNLYGIVGAAVATAISFVVNLGLHTYYLSKFVTIIFPYRPVAWCFLSSGAMFLVLRALLGIYTVRSFSQLIGIIVVGTICYVVVLLIYPPIRLRLYQIITTDIFST